MFQAKVYKVMIGCPGGILEEQNTALRVIEDWNIREAERKGVVFIPEIWKGQPIDADLFIGIFGSWIGKNTSEIESYAAKGNKAVLFFKSYHDPETSMRSEVEELNSFKARVKVKCIDYDSRNDMREYLLIALKSL